jgi:hypothetical protein
MNGTTDIATSWGYYTILRIGTSEISAVGGNDVTLQSVTLNTINITLAEFEADSQQHRS